MTTNVTVRATQGIVGWPEGSVHTVVETGLVKKLIADGRLEVVSSDEAPAAVRTPDVSTARVEMTAMTEVVEGPPRGGAGATAENWRAFLDEKGLSYPDDAGREELIAIFDGSRE
jgi:hypothetical protein